MGARRLPNRVPLLCAAVVTALVVCWNVNSHDNVADQPCGRSGVPVFRTYSAVDAALVDKLPHEWMPQETMTGDVDTAVPRTKATADHAYTGGVGCRVEVPTSALHGVRHVELSNMGPPCMPSTHSPQCTQGALAQPMRINSVLSPEAYNNTSLHMYYKVGPDPPQKNCDRGAERKTKYTTAAVCS